MVFVYCSPKYQVSRRPMVRAICGEQWKITLNSEDCVPGQGTLACGCGCVWVLARNTLVWVLFGALRCPLCYQQGWVITFKRADYLYCVTVRVDENRTKVRRRSHDSRTRHGCRWCTHLVKELLPRGVGLEGELQLCVHGDDAHVDLHSTKQQPVTRDELWRKTRKRQHLTGLCH